MEVNIVNKQIKIMVDEHYQPNPNFRLTEEKDYYE